MDKWDAIIVGGGACGLMCAVQAGFLGKKVLLLERNAQLGAKILISGGGRCNYTNLHTTTENFVSEDPDFADFALKSWAVQDTLEFFESRGIVGAEKTLGQIFPKSHKAKDIVALFEVLLKQYKVDYRLEHLVNSIEKVEEFYQVQCETPQGLKSFTAPKVVLASGGLPVAKLGASDFALRVAKNQGAEIVQTAPALVPLVITGKNSEWFANLSGNTVFSRVSIGSISFEENILFTHWGLSGPAILQISSYWRPGMTLKIDLLPQVSFDALLKEERGLGGKKLVSQLLQPYFSKKMLTSLGELLPLHIKVASLGKADAKLIQQTLYAFEVKPASDKGYDKAEVMRGGISTKELNPQTLELYKSPGMFAGGEAVDITGWLGGYNFQWAWASAFLIAKQI